MSVTDPISDMLTMVKNASAAGKQNVDVKSSKINEGILGIFKNEKFIQNFKPIPDKKQGLIRVYLRFDENKNAAIRGIKRISKPSRRVYVKGREIPKVFGGLGVAIVSTSKGLMTDADAREKNLGGEILCYAW